jgi:hypothetical protein
MTLSMKKSCRRSKKAPVERQQTIVPVDPNASPFVDAEMMASLARQAKEAQGKMLRKQ